MIPPTTTAGVTRFSKTKTRERFLMVSDIFCFSFVKHNFSVAVTMETFSPHLTMQCSVRLELL